MTKIISILFCIVLLNISCNTDLKTSHQNKSVFRYNESAGISSLDPAFARNAENIWAVNQLYNGLVQMNDNLEVKPCIAKSWEISEDGLTYTFFLKTDIYFHDHKLFPKGKGRKVREEFARNRGTEPKKSVTVNCFRAAAWKTKSTDKNN